MKVKFGGGPKNPSYSEGIVTGFGPWVYVKLIVSSPSLSSDRIGSKATHDE